MKKIYPKDFDIKYAHIYLPVSIFVLVVMSFILYKMNELGSAFSFLLVLLWFAAMLTGILCIGYYICLLQRGYYIYDGKIETRFWAGKKKKSIVLSDIKGVCICYGYVQYSQYGSVKIKTKRNLIIDGEKVHILCPYISLLSNDMNYVVPNMSNIDICRCTGSEEIYGFAVFSMESVAELIKNFQGIYYIPVDIYEKYKTILEKMINQYQIPSDRIKILAVR